MVNVLGLHRVVLDCLPRGHRGSQKNSLTEYVKREEDGFLLFKSSQHESRPQSLLRAQDKN